MAIIKLTEPGQAHVMAIVKVEDDRSGNYPDWKFTDAAGNALHIPQKAMERQLTRLGVTSAFQLQGETVKFSRSEKPGTNGKLFYNADLATPAERSPKDSPRVASPYQPPRETAPPRGVSAGPRIPDMDGPPDWSDVPNAGEDGPYAEPPLTPREEREAKGQFDPRPHEGAYLALWSRVAEHQVREGKRLGFPVDGSSVQAATFSIWGLR